MSVRLVYTVKPLNSLLNRSLLLLFACIACALLSLAQAVQAVPEAAELKLEVMGHTLILRSTDLERFPRKTVTVLNGHTKTTESYSGVLLSDLLLKAGAPLGDQLHGKAVTDSILAQGSDGYKAVLSIAEVDPSFHSGDVIVADTLNGKPLEKQGPFQLVVTEDKRPARWVRNLVSIQLVEPGVAAAPQ